MRHWHLGTKLTFWSVLIVTGALAASLVSTRIYIERQETAELDKELGREIAHFFEEFREHGARISWIVPREMQEVLPAVRDPEHLVIITATDGRVLYRSSKRAPDSFLTLPAGAHKVNISSTELRLRVASNDQLRLFVANDMTEMNEMVNKVTQAHFVALPLVLVLAAVGGWWLARQALLPVKAIADAADAIRPEDLTTRLTEQPQRDEIGRLARAFNRMLERLERGFRQATRFSADASHELRTPLTILRTSIADLLDDPDFPESHREAVADLQFQTHSLISITNSLLLLARADAGRLQLNLESADLAFIINDCLEDARIVAEQREVVVDCAPLPRTPVRVDAVRVRQILLNLLDNAVKYNRPQGRVYLQLSLSGTECHLRLGNSGPGIPAEAQRNLFERFYRAGQHEDIPGAGLGLSLSRELARTHGGELALVTSREGWTEFELRLPIYFENSDSPVSHYASAS